MHAPSDKEELHRILRSKKRKKRGVAFSVLVLTISLHLIAAFIAGAIYIAQELVQEEGEFELPPVMAAPQKRPEYQVNIQKLKEKSSPPRPRPIVVHDPNNIELPALHIPQIGTNIAITGRGAGGFGVGIGGGDIPKVVVNVEFFGAKAEGAGNFVFILDTSTTMIGDARRITSRREVIRSIESMPDGINVAVIVFGGFPADVMIDGSSESKNYGNSDGDSTTRPKRWGDVTIPKWIKLSQGVRKRLYKAIRNAPKIVQTMYDLPFYLALKMDPPPSTIFFLTDGAGQKSERSDLSIKRLMEEFKKVKGDTPKIQCIGFEIDDDDKGLIEKIARIGRGRATIVNSADYIRKHGPSKEKFPEVSKVSKSYKKLKESDNPVETWRLFSN